MSRTLPLALSLVVVFAADGYAAGHGGFDSGDVG